VNEKVNTKEFYRRLAHAFEALEAPAACRYDLTMSVVVDQDIFIECLRLLGPMPVAEARLQSLKRSAVLRGTTDGSSLTSIDSPDR
jgi:hypothetical protein